MPAISAYLVVLAAVAGTTFVSLFAVRRLAVRVGAVVKPDERRVHARPTPTLGGLAMGVGLLVGLAVAWRMEAFAAVSRGSTEPLGVALAAVLWGAALLGLPLVPDDDGLGTAVIGFVLLLLSVMSAGISLAFVIARAGKPLVRVTVIEDLPPRRTGFLAGQVDAPDDFDVMFADEIAATDARVHVLHRAAKQGLGAAYRAGMRWALEADYDRIVEMDADGSHPAERLPAMLAESLRADLVIGSRWVPGGTTVGWAWERELISRSANIYARAMLGVPARDMTAGYRVYRAPVLRRIDLDPAASTRSVLEHQK